MADKYVLNPNDFEVERELGRGNFGCVQLVKNKKDPTIHYALKIISEEQQDKDSPKMFIREVFTLISVNHPAVLSMGGFAFPSKKGDPFFIFTEYMPNKNMKEIMALEQRGQITQFNDTKKMICIIGIAAGMQVVHGQNIIHRDLKPENIFFDKDFYPKIADFGLARFTKNDAEHRTGNLGTPYFMAPELFDEDATIGPAVDVYAYALVILTIFDPVYKFVGKKPGSIVALINYISSGKRYLLPKNIPLAYKRLIEACWDGDAKERPTFKEIYEMIAKNIENYVIGDADLAEVREYVEFINPNSNNFKLKNSEEIAEVDIEEEEEEIGEETEEFDFGM
ncbi:hypothetical protein TRFO_06258 [Tritrichomonas foetus]|uniref:Protein kinase domain-containing protein n=1 Tax=Tritrichomonas foetus TaxID=1144522 RepID=A0A1J4K0M0_9EUKA|nr:hypothetical protein TRFO_06258 [Tritrichomonas foetus]|eukprot:OHT04795.1 hypothetical protein TRFO_06258 [Tritrichomonas foetus]